MSIFIAFYPSSEVQHTLSEYAKQTQGVSKNFVLTRPERIHLTLAFLGKQPSQEVITDTQEVLSQVVSHHSAFSLHIQTLRIGFPNQNSSRILLAVPDSSDCLTQLVIDLHNRLASYNIHPPVFTYPHFTLGRRNKPLSASAQIQIQRTLHNTSLSVTANVSTVKLMQSTFLQTGVSYETLSEVSLIKT
ncbi:MAG: RNA 2',3'-cyclic phosphodiesterase [Candidatus Paceibacteria bacterium]